MCKTGINTVHTEKYTVQSGVWYTVYIWCVIIEILTNKLYIEKTTSLECAFTIYILMKSRPRRYRTKEGVAYIYMSQTITLVLHSLS